MSGVAGILLALLVLCSSLALAIGLGYWSTNLKPFALFDFGGSIRKAQSALDASAAEEARAGELAAQQKAAEIDLAATRAAAEKTTGDILAVKFAARKQLLQGAKVTLSGLCTGSPGAISTSVQGLGTFTVLTNPAMRLADVRAFDIPEGVEVVLTGTDGKTFVLSAGGAQTCLASASAPSAQPEFVAKSDFRSITVRVVDDDALRELVKRTL
jgi:hypothetical protein